jgi:hypothetical protein
MEHGTEEIEGTEARTREVGSPPFAPAPPGDVEDAPLFPQAGRVRELARDTGGGRAAPFDTEDSPTFVYALGRIEPRFPSLGIEKEFAQATGRADTGGLTDREAVHKVLTQRENRYLARQICWVLAVEGTETYVVVPRDSADLDLLIEAVRPVPRLADVDVVIGVRAGMTSPGMCGGMVLPVVVFDAIYSFDVDALIDSIPRPKEIPAKSFKATAEELFVNVLQLADNAGATDDHRAVNYLAVRHPGIYELVARQHARNASLSRLEVRPSRLSGARKIVKVIGSFVHRETDVVEKYFLRVDVTEEFPFLVTKLSPFVER